MDETQSGTVHQGNARAECTQQANESSMHQRLDKEVQVGPLQVFEVEVDGEALIEYVPQQGIGKEVHDEETRHQVFADSESPLVLTDERSS